MTATDMGRFQRTAIPVIESLFNVLKARAEEVDAGFVRISWRACENSIRTTCPHCRVEYR